jgi:hypothetical protein
MIWLVGIVDVLNLLVQGVLCGLLVDRNRFEPRLKLRHLILELQHLLFTEEALLLMKLFKLMHVVLALVPDIWIRYWLREHFHETLKASDSYGGAVITLECVKISLDLHDDLDLIMLLIMILIRFLILSLLYL